jgi:hypothetical protein
VRNAHSSGNVELSVFQLQYNLFACRTEQNGSLLKLRRWEAARFEFGQYQSCSAPRCARKQSAYSQGGKRKIVGRPMVIG